MKVNNFKQIKEKLTKAYQEAQAKSQKTNNEETAYAYNTLVGNIRYDLKLLIDQYNHIKELRKYKASEERVNKQVEYLNRELEYFKDFKNLNDFKEEYFLI